MSEEGTAEHLSSSSLTINWGSGVGDPGPQVSVIKEGSVGRLLKTEKTWRLDKWVALSLSFLDDWCYFESCNLPGLHGSVFVDTHILLVVHMDFCHTKTISIALCNFPLGNQVTFLPLLPTSVTPSLPLYLPLRAAQVNLVSEHIWCKDFLVRSFYLKNVQTQETRTLTQFHLLSWPADGIPTSTRPLLDFRRWETTQACVLALDRWQANQSFSDTNPERSGRV